MSGEVGQMSIFTAQSEGTDTTAPEIALEETTTVVHGADFDPLAGVTATDDTDGDLTSSLQVLGTVDTGRIGTYTLVYSVADANGNQATTPRTVEVVAPPAPVNIVRPSISGTGEVGKPVTLDVGTWENADTAERTVRWFRNGVAIDGADGTDHVVTAADRGKTLTAVVRTKVVGNDVVVARTDGFDVPGATKPGRKAVKVTLTGKNNGKKADRLKATTSRRRRSTPRVSPTSA